MKRTITVTGILILILGFFSFTSSQVPKGGRQLGIALSFGDMPFEKAFNLGKAAGLQVTTLGLHWDVLEPAPGRFEAGDNPKIDAFFASQKISLALGLEPIDTFANRLPRDLKGKAFDDPAVLTRFQQAFDFQLRQFPTVTWSSFNIGNEVDVMLGADSQRWKAYETFFGKAADYVRSRRAGLKVGVRLTFGGLTGPNRSRAQALNQHADVVLVTYYPLKADFQVEEPAQVHRDFDTLAKLYPGKEIRFMEIGYPASKELGSSETKQAEFVRESFRAWDKHAAQFSVLTFFALTDLTRADRDRAVKYFGVRGNRFPEYLGTLGLHYADGRAKEGYGALKAEAKARGW